MTDRTASSLETAPEPERPPASSVATGSTPPSALHSETDATAGSELDAEQVAADGGQESASNLGQPRPDASEGDFLDELLLPSLVRALEPLAPGSEVGPTGPLKVTEYLGTRGQVNLYTAIWRSDGGDEVEVELREGPTDHDGLRRDAEILSNVQYAMLPRCYLTWESGDRRYVAVERRAGQTLREALAVALPVERALSIVLQLVQVARRLHRAGWALLGLTPADVSLGDPIQVRHLWQAGRIGEPAPQALQVAGYSAPELAYQEPVTGKEDVYTLGAILYAALAGGAAMDGEIDLADLAAGVRLPGGPQILADALAPADERPDLEAFYLRLLNLKGRYGATSVSLEVASATTLGLNPTRLANEDSSCYAVWARTGAEGVGETALLCVADGMGGMEAGEVASQTAISVVMNGAVRMVWAVPSEADASMAAAESSSDSALSSEKTSAIPRVGGGRIEPAALVRRAATAVHAAGQGRDLGTTITCLAVHDGELILAHVGDTRAYLLRKGVLTRLTADHSLVAAMVASGVITPEEAQGHPDSNKVLRSLGSQRELPASYVDGLEAAYGQPTLRLEPGDVLLVCSDGVWGTVDDREIQVVLAEALDAQIAAQVLIDRALAGGAPDNATAVVARVVRRPIL